MRTVFDPQMTFGQVDIADIKLNTKSRDDIPQLLRGLQQHPHRPRIAQERLCHPWGNAPRACGRGRQGQPDHRPPRHGAMEHPRAGSVAAWVERRLPVVVK